MPYSFRALTCGNSRVSQRLCAGAVPFPTGPVQRCQLGGRSRMAGARSVTGIARKTLAFTEASRRA